MNIIAKALDEIKFSIPVEVLRVTFQDDLHNWRSAPVSLDQQILEKVIKPRVLIDANIVGGMETIISLDGLTPKYIDTHSIVYEVPPERIAYKEIVSVLSVSYLPYAVGGIPGAASSNMFAPGCTPDTLMAGQRVMNSHASIPIVSNASADLVGFNTVLIRDNYRTSMVYQLRCMLANEANLSNINPRSYLAFSDLCKHAVKAFIYNKLIVKMDQAYLTGGQELGALKQIVETYSDSNENYRTFLREVWGRVSVFSDSVQNERFLRRMISPGI